tara:strand:- start:169 stop:687 length:519 start_codon:yes stop_codon:yes gene_type:complete
MVQQWVLLRPIPNLLNQNPLTEIQTKELIEILYKLKTEQNMPHLIENAIPFCCYTPEKVAAVSFGAGNEDGRKGLVVDSEGMLKADYFFESNLGKAGETSLEEAWENEFMQNIRTDVYLPEKCFSCLYKKQCRGGSRFSAQYANKDIRALDPLARPDKYIKRKGKQVIANKV